MKNDYVTFAFRFPSLQGLVYKNESYVGVGPLLFQRCFFSHLRDFPRLAHDVASLDRLELEVSCHT